MKECLLFGGTKQYGKDTPIPLTFILGMKPYGLDNALWFLPHCLETDKARKISQIFARDCAEHVLHIYEKYKPDDNRPRNCITPARRFIEGKATQEELDAARAARDAAKAAAWAALDADRAAEVKWQKERFTELLNSF